MWSVGCIFAELLGRRILFEAATPLLQLDMITELLGSPSREDATSIVSTTALKHLFAKSKPVSDPVMQYIFAPLVKWLRWHTRPRVPVVASPAQGYTSEWGPCLMALFRVYLCVVQPASPLRSVLPCHTRSGAPAVRDAQVLAAEPPHGSRSPLPPLLGRWPSSLPHHALLLLPYSQWEHENVLQWYVH